MGVLLLLVGLGVGPAAAQQPTPDDPRIGPGDPIPQLEVTEKAKRNLSVDDQEKLKTFLREELDPRAARRLLQQIPEAVQPKKPEVLQAKAIGGVPETGQDQSWALNQNPNPRLNFDLLGTPEYAGDVNDDGVDDYLYEQVSSFGRDQRTAALEDFAAKSALFLGGTPTDGQTEDQLVYASLQPVGDINSDGFDDAVAGDGRIFLGGSAGYTESDRDIGFSRDVAGFADFDGDGIDDALLWFYFSNEYRVLYGADQVSNVTVEDVSTPEFEGFFSNLNVGDVDGDNQSEIVRHAVRNDTTVIEIFQVERGITEISPAQQFQSGYPSFSFFPLIFKPAVVDVNGDGTNEIIPVEVFSFFGPTRVFDSDTNGNYGGDPAVFDKGAVPVGDLDGDGNHDFFTIDPSSGNQFTSYDRYISYGPDSLSDGLSFDTEIPFSENVYGGVRMNFRNEDFGRFGDLTGDGRPNTVLSYFDQTPSDRRVGRRFVSVGEGNRPAEAQTTDATYPRGHFLDRIGATEEIGDFSDDGSPDFAMVREDLSRIEIFNGGQSISSSPDQTIEAPVSSFYSTITSGDFNGDGVPDIAAGYGDGTRVDVYFGGTSAGSPDHVIDTSDTESSRLWAVQNVGDVNDSGADDLLVTNRFADDTTQVSLFFGGTSLPNTADRIIEYPNFSAGQEAVALGDVNGDGTDDFAVGVPEFNQDRGRVDVYFGEANPSFSSAAPDQKILADESSARLFGRQLAAGDFNGDGSRDLAVQSSRAPISVFYWEDAPDDVVDQRLTSRLAAGPRGFGALETVGDADGDGADELLLGSDFSTNAALYRPSEGSDPVRVLRAPNQRASLGPGPDFSGNGGQIASGDFTGDGNTDIVLTQEFDNNDAFLSSRVYRFGIDQLTRSSEVVYVDKDAKGDSTGTSWADAYTDLQTAIEDAAAIDEIWVAAGTYKPNPSYDGDRSTWFRFTGAWDGLEIYGGFAGDETFRGQRDPDANEVVLSGDLGTENDSTDNSYHVLTLDGTTPDGPITDSTVIAGVTITGGNADGGGDLRNAGGGVLCRGAGPDSECSPQFRNVVFRNNSAAFGGAMFNHADNSGTSNPVYEEVTFVANSAEFTGGAIYNDGTEGVSSPVFRGVVFEENVATSGGALGNEGVAGVSSPQMEDVQFLRNVADGGSGGAILNFGLENGEGNPEIETATFRGNTAYFGSAMYNFGQGGESSPVITDAVFADNVAEKSGTIYNDATGGGEASPEISGSVFAGNEADFGAGMYNDGANASGKKSSFGPSSGPSGGAALQQIATDEGTVDRTSVTSKTPNAGPANPHVVNTTFRGNVADTSGGAMYNNGTNGTSRPHLTNVTIAGNEAQYGGALYNDASNGGTAEPQVDNTILWGNTAPNGPTVFNNATGADPAFSHSILEGSGGSGSGWVDSLGTDGGGNLDEDPLFAASAGPDEEWGTEDDDIRLQGPGSPLGASPAIDAGDNGALASGVSEDLGGETRRQDVGDVSDTGSGTAPIVDIGAYESDGSAQVEYTSESQEVTGDGSYEYTQSGCVFNFSGTSGSGTVTAERFGSAPENAAGITGRLLNARLVVSVEGGLSFDSTEVRIDASTLPTNVDPSKLVMYRRGTAGEGDFVKLTTNFDTDARELWAKVASFGEFAVVVDAPPAPSSLASTLGEGEIGLNWEAPDATGLAKYYVYRSLSPIDSLEGISELSPIDSVSASSTSYTDTDVEEGTTYYYRVTAVDEDGIEGAVSAQIQVFLYPQNVTANVSRSFGDASGAGDYRLVALPGAADTSLADVVSGEAGAEWQAYWDDGSDSDFLVRFDGSDTFRFQAGNGFWLTSRQDWTSSAELPAVDLEGDTAAVVDLHGGWNIVSNPLDKEVAFAAIDAVNEGVLQPFWSFAGGAFGAPDTVASARSGKAYYFFNEQGLDALRIPYPGAPGSPAAPKAKENEVPMLALSASTADGPSSTVRIGLSETRRALFAPPGRFEATSLRIEAEEASGRSGLLMAERRPLEGGGETFRLRLTSEADGPVELSVENLDAIEGQSVALLHPSAGKTYDLREESTIQVEPEGETVELKLAIGTSGYVKSKTEEVLPETVRLSSYPNPIRTQGTIEYALPEQKKVTLRVYDVLGRQVATLAQGRKEAGRHTVRLETDQLASGVYFGRLTAGDQTLTRKITVVR